MFETERLSLRRLTENDADEVFALRKDAEVMRFIREPQINRAESINWIKLVSGLWETEEIGFCGIFEKSSNKFVGWCGLWRLQETGETEVGYAVGKTFWGRGFAVESSETFLRYGFEKLNLEKIVAVARPENTASRRVMEKLGMKFDHTGKYYGRDLVHYSIRKEDLLRSKV